jgi:hypothetical protein
MNAPRIKRTLFLIAFGSMFALGCELIVDFDRTKIPVEDAGAGPVDAAPQDATASDAELDAPGDAPSDAPSASDASDAGEDAADAADAADGD